MLYLLLLALVILALVGYFAFKKDALSPSFLICCIFIFGTVMAIIGNKTWELTISFKTIFIVLFGIIFIFVGEFFCRKFVKIKNDNSHYICSFCYSRKIYFILLIIQGIISFLYFKRVLSLASTLGETNDLWTLLTRIRVVTINYGIKVGAFFSIFGNVSTAITFCGVFLLFNSYKKGSIFRHILKNKLVIVSVFLFFFVQLISGARNGFILFAVFFFISLLLCIKRKKKRINVVVLLSSGVLLIGLFSVVFSIVGVRMGKTSDSNALGEVVRYSGGSFFGLSAWLETGESSSHIGQESFWGLRHLLHMVFPSIYDGSEFYDPVEVNFKYITGVNIFTGFRAFYSDFSYLGLSLIPFLVGFIYTYYLCKIELNYKPITVVLYSYMFYFYVNLLFAPSVTSSLFTSSQVSSIFWIFVIGKILFFKSEKAAERSFCIAL